MRVKQTNGMCLPDQRGTYKRRKDDHKINEKFLDSFPHFQSHYTSTENLYLSPKLNKTTMYKLYREKITEDPIGEKQFMTILKSYKIKFIQIYNTSARHLSPMRRIEYKIERCY